MKKKSHKPSIPLHNSLHIVVSMASGLVLHIRVSVAVSVPAQVHYAKFWPCLLLPVLGASAGGGLPRALGHLTRAKGAALSWDVLTQHDHPVLQVTDGTLGAAGGAVQPSLGGAELLLQTVHHGEGVCPQLQQCPNSVQTLPLQFFLTVLQIHPRMRLWQMFSRFYKVYDAFSPSRYE